MAQETCNACTHGESSSTVVPKEDSNVPVPGNPWDDATWILTSSFIIFTMQSGFGLLESGLASKKDEVNIMVKNIVDVVFGGITYWMLGYGLSFGTEYSTNFFCGVGSFFLNPDDENMGTEFSQFIFQASFATTATTIVSGAMAGRTKLMAYIIFSSINTFIYCFPAHWIWAENGWLRTMDVVDIAGDGPVHLVGGVTALVAALMLGPRKGRFTSEDDSYRMSSPTSALLGMFILWWGWLGFNCGSTFGISGGKWKLASRAATTTILSTCGGGITSLTLSYILENGKFDVGFIINGILGALVSITGTCAVTTTWEAIIIGSVGSIVCCAGEKLLHKLKVDDPVGAVPVHFFCAAWGLLAAGFFAHRDTIVNSFSRYDGLVRGGGFYLLGVQALAVVSLTAWSAVTSFFVLLFLKKTIGIRCSPEEELIGADYCEHGVIHQDLEESVMILILKREKEKTKLRRNRTRRMSIATGGHINETISVDPDVIQNEEIGTVARHVHFANNHDKLSSIPNGISNGTLRKSSLSIDGSAVDPYDGAYELNRFDKYNTLKLGKSLSSEVTKL